jgi:Raf kinase inhibitor-like YbhB/YbcL family protein
MILSSLSFRDGERIPNTHAFCKPDPHTHVTLADNLSPELSWSQVPEGARSFVLTCHDPDVPSVGADVNQEGKRIPADLPRVDFFHWLLVDIPAAARCIEAGADSSGVTPGGKPTEPGPHGSRRGRNNFSDWFAGDPAMGGSYLGYDGPCPPWNDTRLHHYVFTLYALDIERCPVEGAFDGPSLRAAISGHVLDQASLTAVYSVNPELGA